MSEPTHTPTCEVNRGGDHGPCSCGRDAEMRRERLAKMSGEEIVALLRTFAHDLSAACLNEDEERFGGNDADKIARHSREQVTDAICSLARQRDALRQAAEATAAGCRACGGLGYTDYGEGIGPIACDLCSRLRAALEVR